MFLPPGFDRAIAIEAAGLVNQAYDQYQQFAHGATWYLQGDYDQLGILSARPVGPRVEPFGFVARNRTSGHVFVTFRGTESIADWASNLSFPQVDHPWGRAEKGFKDLYDQCSAPARAAVQQAPGAAVFVTGHSLGGALATLAAADLVASRVSPGASLYNFASPRVGDPGFASRFNASVPNRWRIVNTEDIVTTVPMATPELVSSGFPNSPLEMFLMLAHHMDYEHVGYAVTFTTHNGSIIANHQMSTYTAAL
jgi:triacylglycerol lipase